MTELYVKVGTDLIGHPKTLDIGADGFALYVGGLCYAQRHLTDGLIPKSALLTLVPMSWFGELADHDVTQEDENISPTSDDYLANIETLTSEQLVIFSESLQSAAGRLRRSGLWKYRRNEYEIVNYLSWNRSRLEVEKVRAQTRDRVRKHRAGAGDNLPSDQ